MGQKIFHDYLFQNRAFETRENGCCQEEKKKNIVLRGIFSIPENLRNRNGKLFPTTHTHMSSEQPRVAAFHRKLFPKAQMLGK